jgi:hypothetical protein
MPQMVGEALVQFRVLADREFDQREEGKSRIRRRRCSANVISRERQAAKCCSSASSQAVVRSRSQ